VRVVGAHINGQLRYLVVDGGNLAVQYRNLFRRRKLDIKIEEFDFMSGWELVRADGFDARKATASQKSSLTKLRDRWEEKFEQSNQEMLEVRVRSARWARRLKDVALRLSKNYRALQDDHEERRARMEKQFSTEMQLRSAEKFWSHKRRLNRKRARAAFKRLCWVGGLGIPLLLSAYYCINWAIDLPMAFSVPHAIAYGVPTLIYVWLLRILANEYRNNQHMADDAEEREAMVFTFKALEHEQRVGDDERLVILNALFRPHGKGAEESVPMPVWEAIVGRHQRPD